MLDKHLSISDNHTTKIFLRKQKKSMCFVVILTLGLLQGGKCYMKTKLIKFFVIAALGALVLSACEIPGTTAKSVTTGEGTVKISMPRINPFIVASQSKSLNTKAFAYVDTIELDFYQGGEIVKAVNLGETSYDDAANTISGSISVLAGTYDKLTVSIFNTAVSAEVPVVSGQTDGSFEVPVSGTVDLSVVLYPSDPVALTDGSYANTGTLNEHGESWYLFYAPNNNSTVTLKTLAGTVDAYIFGPDAKPLNGITGSGVANAEDSVTFETEPESVYYVCVVARAADSSGQIKFNNASGTVNITFY